MIKKEKSRVNKFFTEENPKLMGLSQFGCILNILFFGGILFGVLWGVRSCNKSIEAEEKRKVETKLKEDNALLSKFNYPSDIIEEVNLFAQNLNSHRAQELDSIITGRSLFIEIRQSQIDSLKFHGIKIESLYCNNEFSDSIIAWNEDDLKQVVFLINDRESVGNLYHIMYYRPHSQEQLDENYKEENKTAIKGYRGLTTVAVFSYPDMSVIGYKTLKYDGDVSLKIRMKPGDEYPEEYTSPRLTYQQIEENLYIQLSRTWWDGNNY